jgi:hypothetical protein
MNPGAPSGVFYLSLKLKVKGVVVKVASGGQDSTLRTCL